MNNRILLKYHSYLGIITGVFLLIIGLSGAVLAFHKEIDAVLFKEYQVYEDAGVLELDKAIKTIQNQFPEWETRIVRFNKGESILFNLRLPDARRYVFVHPRTGHVIANIDANTYFTKWILKLHYSLHAGTVGRIMVFVIGILYFLALITGVILYRKVIVKTLLFRVKLNRSRRRNFYSALHRYVGVWALLLNLLLVVTGVFISFNVAKAGLQTPETPAPVSLNISVETCIQKIKNEYPDFEPTYIRLPKNMQSDLVVNGVFSRDPFYLSEYYNTFKINSQTGDIHSVIKISEASVLNKLNSMMIPLHFGEYGGFGITLLYCIIGLSGPFLSVTGFIIWKKKRKLNKY
ncbi:PepSY-associated TM helix domain-containing protein [Gaetbulibacter saemankumensis]|uniref:PepSY-associated TM helix domain-containing protein n=1 Tax=Gaetbulibacter saemankumensis TaxID=311208 RepID=UPI0004223E1E|nr:PepSY-associated TM helix domain-containing protein [Gaetbulibacter saemankumensis]